MEGSPTLTIAALTLSTVAGIGCLAALLTAVRADNSDRIGIALPAVGLIFALVAPIVWLMSSGEDASGAVMADMPAPLPTMWSWCQAHAATIVWVGFALACVVGIKVAIDAARRTQQ